MIQSKMYCAEQIVIPAKFPNILKTYAKAVIKTQPYDLLRWSAAYFRCMALNVTPPVKPRLEQNCAFGHLTKGYLRVLLEQMGKGFFINRDVLQNQWESLSLPEDELLGFLSLCRMLQWPKVHWLKLFSVMVGSLNNNFKATLDMLCELLTNEPEGGPSPIPMWMFRECYSFIAELNCAEEQTFEDGRKLLPNGELEPPTEMPDLPKMLDLLSFRNAILEKFNDRLGIEHNLDPTQFAYADDGTVDSTRTNSGRISGVSSSFKFIGDYESPTEIIRRTPDFDSVILLLHETQGYELHSFAEPGVVSAKNLRHANKREADLLAERKRQANDIAKRSKNDEEQKKKLKNIEPPWSWIHEFASLNGREKSYNFLEYQSIASDETPSESSEESFEFDNSAKKTDSIDSCEFGIEEALLAGNKISEREEQVGQTIHDVLESVIEFVEAADRQRSINISDTGSILALIQTQHSSSDELNVEKIIEILQEAQKNQKTFIDLNQLKAYLNEKLGIDNNIQSSGESVKDKSIVETAEIPSAISISSKETSKIEEGKSDSEFVADTTIIEAIPPIPQIEDKFIECAIEIDEKVAGAVVPEKMILGLMDTPSEHSIEPSPIIPTPPITPPSPTYATSGIDQSLISSKIIETTPSSVTSSLSEFSTIPPSYKCCMPALPGIGKSVSKETMQNFLTYLKARSRDENGMILPRMFKEAKCPNMVDCYEG